MRPYALVAIAFFMSAPVLAQQSSCGEREKILLKLSKDYGERVVNMGLAKNGAVFEVLASESGSWTIVQSRPNGLSCVMAAGQAWENIERKPTEKGKPS